MEPMMKDIVEQLEARMERLMREMTTNLSKQMERMIQAHVDQLSTRVEQLMRDLRVENKEMIKCAKCKAEVTKFLCHFWKGWLCEHCLPEKRICVYEHEGCTYKDFYGETAKHELKFCPYLTRCQSCRETLPLGSYLNHMITKHWENRVHESGSTWRIKGNWVMGGLVSAAGRGYYYFSYSKDSPTFHLKVLTPLHSERKHEFQCTIMLTDPASGHSRTYEPDHLYQCWEDWSIRCKITEFPTWSEEFDACVTISHLTHNINRI